MSARNVKRVNVYLGPKHDAKLDSLARQTNKTRSAVLRDAIDRMLTPVPDSEQSHQGNTPPFEG